MVRAKRRARHEQGTAFGRFHSWTTNSLAAYVRPGGNMLSKTGSQ